MPKIKLIALIGPSGSGKDYIFQKLKKTITWANFVIPTTTRPKRENERNGVNYHFITNEQFESLRFVEQSSFMVNGGGIWKYGTAITDLRFDTVNIGIYDPCRVKELLNNNLLDITVYYIEASPKVRLLRQLNREKTPNVSEIVRRYQNDINDFISLPFPHNSCFNETKQDAKLIVKCISADAKAQLDEIK